MGLFEKLKVIFKTKELRNKVLFTFAMVAIFIIGGFIPVPFVSSDALQNLVSSNTLFSLYDMVSGGNFSNFTIFSMSVTPYINASIIISLLTFVIPSLKELQEEGETGQKVIKKYTIIFGLLLAVVQATALVVTQQDNIDPYNFWTALLIVAILTAGVGCLIWIGNLIDDHGIGNGISVIIFAGIVSRIPSGIRTLFDYLDSGTLDIVSFVVLVVVIGAALCLVVAIEDAEKDIPIQYSQRNTSSVLSKKVSSTLPIKPNMSGVIPIIFANTIVLLPNTIAQFVPESKFAEFVGKYFAWGGVASTILYMILIFAFTYFYTIITFDIKELSKNLQMNGAYIPGIRPGEATEEYIKDVVYRLTFFGALFLCIIAIIPNIMGAWLGINVSFGGTSLLILVSVALDMNKSLTSDITMYGNYKGFLK